MLPAGILASDREFVRQDSCSFHGIRLGDPHVNHYWLWFLIWLFLSAWLTVTWAFLRYGREFWNRTQPLMAHAYYLHQI